MISLLKAANFIGNTSRNLRRLYTITILRLKGVKIHPSANIHPNAVFEASGGSISIGSRTFIDRGVVIRALGGSVVIGNDCSVNAYTVLYGCGGLSIGNDVRIAVHAVIIPAKHIFSDSSIPIRTQGSTMKGIIIEDDVWIGAGAKILDGVVLGKGAVVGASAVVTKTIDPYSVVAGVPAKCIYKR